jgi:drug/metabolite transporter (DMT)-like permease
VRTGSEPSQARSPLRLRLGLCVFGLCCALAGVLGSAVVGAPAGWVIGFGVLGLVALVDLAFVVRRIRQGPHFQPGRSVPPYRPVDAAAAIPADGRRPAPMPVRRRWYLLLMAVCLLLFVFAWTWVRLYSVTAAVVMSVIASAIPPLAAIVANAGSPITRR